MFAVQYTIRCTILYCFFNDFWLNFFRLGLSLSVWTAGQCCCKRTSPWTMNYLSVNGRSLRWRRLSTTQCTSTVAVEELHGRRRQRRVQGAWRQATRQCHEMPSSHWFVRSPLTVTLALLRTFRTKEVDGMPFGKCLRPGARTHAQTDEQAENLMPPAPSVWRAEAQPDYQYGQLAMRLRQCRPYVRRWIWTCVY